PTISSLGSRSVGEDTDTGPIPFTIGDIETAGPNLTVTATSSNTVLVPNGNIVLGGSGTNRALSLIPATNQTGTAIISVAVSDGTTSANSVLTLTVTGTNDPPTISVIPDQIITEDTALTNLPFTVSDPDTAVGSISVNGASSNQGLVPNGAVIVTGTTGSRNVTVTPLP